MLIFMHKWFFLILQNQLNANKHELLKKLWNKYKKNHANWASYRAKGKSFDLFKLNSSIGFELKLDLILLIVKYWN